MNIDVFLCLIAMEALPSRKHQSKILMSLRDGKRCLPYRPLIESKTSSQLIYEMLEEYTQIGSQWIKPLSFGIFDDLDRTDDPERVVAVLYGAFIPEPVRLYSDEVVWMTYDEIKNSAEGTYGDTLKLIQESVWRPIL